MTRRRLAAFAALQALGAFPIAQSSPVLAEQAPVAASTEAIDPRGIAGSCLLAGGGKLPDAIIERFLKIAGGQHARVVIVPTASRRADTEAGRQRTLERWQGAHPGIAFVLLHTRDREQANKQAFTAAIRNATAVWFGGGAQARLSAAYVGTRVERELHALLQRGGIIGGSSAGTAIQTGTMIVRGKTPPELGTGLHLLPFAIADQHFSQRERLPRLRQALDLAPGHFGIGIDESTAILVRGRNIEVLGRHSVSFVLPASEGKQQRIVKLTAGQTLDLPTWQRAARQRGQQPWPAKHMGTPFVPHGALVLGGGGRLSDAVFQRFIELAGGRHKARIVIAPTATPSKSRRSTFVERKLRALGVTDVRYLEPEHPSEVTARHTTMIDQATGVWFGGGRQWRIVDAFEGTAVPAALHRVLARGGVIGGSSAGATIQGEFLVRGNPRGNTDMWCEGYDRGFCFLPGCAVDQHFLARDRRKDLQGLVQQVPQALGIGIDEGTAAIVIGSTLEVVGKSLVVIVRSSPTQEQPSTTMLAPGRKWHLVESHFVR